jgi:hypothetical protein
MDRTVIPTGSADEPSFFHFVLFTEHPSGILFTFLGSQTTDDARPEVLHHRLHGVLRRGPSRTAAQCL